jgi:hypothetical protein
MNATSGPVQNANFGSLRKSKRVDQSEDLSPVPICLAWEQKMIRMLTATASDGSQHDDSSSPPLGGLKLQ